MTKKIRKTLKNKSINMKFSAKGGDPQSISYINNTHEIYNLPNDKFIGNPKDNNLDFKTNKIHNNDNRHLPLNIINPIILHNDNDNDKNSMTSRRDNKSTNESNNAYKQSEKYTDISLGYIDTEPKKQSDSNPEKQSNHQNTECHLDVSFTHYTQDVLAEMENIIRENIPDKPESSNFKFFITTTYNSNNSNPIHRGNTVGKSRYSVDNTLESLELLELLPLSRARGKAFMQLNTLNLNIYQLYKDGIRKIAVIFCIAHPYFKMTLHGNTIAGHLTSLFIDLDEGFMFYFDSMGIGSSNHSQFLRMNKTIFNSNNNFNIITQKPIIKIPDDIIKFIENIKYQIWNPDILKLKDKSDKLAQEYSKLNRELENKFKIKSEFLFQNFSKLKTELQEKFKDNSNEEFIKLEQNFKDNSQSLDNEFFESKTKLRNTFKTISSDYIAENVDIESKLYSEFEYINKNFKFIYNTLQHQRLGSSSEVYCLFFIISFLTNKIQRGNNKVHFDSDELIHIFNNKIFDDSIMLIYRRIYLETYNNNSNTKSLNYIPISDTTLLDRLFEDKFVNHLRHPIDSKKMIPINYTIRYDMRKKLDNATRKIREYISHPTGENYPYPSNLSKI